MPPQGSTSRSNRLSIFPQQNLPQNNVAAQKARQLAHLNAKLATLQASLADLESLMRCTTVQAEHVRTLGGICGGMLMASHKVLLDMQQAPRDEDAMET